ncbi:MAG: ATP-binding cassette domain-containing protein [Holosporales bacterium]|jgi:putative ABC transport system ATP-binding protein|nr:ATP-binding cassette domain-containing protein [Holosporales bacterium]
MLKLDNICVRSTLKNLSLTVNTGEFVLIVGANGTGKTTLFNTISGTIFPAKGTIYIDETDITKMPQHKRSRMVSSVIQDPTVGTIGEMSILENLSLAHMRGGKKVLKKDIEYFRERLTILEMNLENRLEEYVKNLSGGQRQALSLVMATITDYDVLLLDEITAALDPKTSDIVMKIASKIVLQENKTCLLITHNSRYINSHTHRILRMIDGKLHES